MVRECPRFSIVERRHLIGHSPALLVRGRNGTANAQQVPDARVADLVKAGKIRIGLFPPQYVKDPATGLLKSAWVKIARALAVEFS
jgi:hypothetical protein